MVNNKPYSRVDVRFCAINAEGKSAEHLATNAGNALLVFERTTWIGQDPTTFVQAVTAPGYQLIALDELAVKQMRTRIKLLA